MAADGLIEAQRFRSMRHNQRTRTAINPLVAAWRAASPAERRDFINDYDITLHALAALQSRIMNFYFPDDILKVSDDDDDCPRSSRPN
jgi:hypothetical protein